MGETRVKLPVAADWDSIYREKHPLQHGRNGAFLRLRRGVDGYHFAIVARNGLTLASSETYSERRKAFEGMAAFLDATAFMRPQVGVFRDESTRQTAPLAPIWNLAQAARLKGRAARRARREAKRALAQLLDRA